MPLNMLSDQSLMTPVRMKFKGWGIVYVYFLISYGFREPFSKVTKLPGCLNSEVPSTIQRAIMNSGYSFEIINMPYVIYFLIFFLKCLNNWINKQI